MVDFNNEVTITTPASDVVRMMILEARYNLFDAIESHLRLKSENVDSSTGIMKSRLWRLFIETEALLKRHMDKEKKDGEEKDFDKLKEFLKGDNVDSKNIITHAGKINATLDKLELIKIDNKKQLGGNIKTRNKVLGWES